MYKCTFSDVIVMSQWWHFFFQDLMTKRNLTPARIRATSLPEGKKVSYIWDAKQDGLGVRITRTAKSYIVQGRISGVSSSIVRIKIDSVDAVTIEKARNTAQTIRLQFAQGIDPREEIKRKAEEEIATRKKSMRQDIVFIDAWNIYVEENKSRWSERHYLAHTDAINFGGKKKLRGKGKTVSGILATFRDLKLSAITPDLITKWLKKETATRSTLASLGFRMLRAFANWCDETETFVDLIHPKACNSRIHRKTLPKPQRRDGCLQKEQLQPWFNAVTSYQNKIISAFFQTTLITGARRNEILTIQWKDIDFKWKSITIKDKVEGQRIIPLTPYVALLLNNLPRCNKWVFSSNKSSTGRIMEPKRANDAIYSVAGIPHLSVHDLRRSFSTLSEWLEMPTGIVAQIMGHKPSALAEKHYKKRPLDLLRMWHIKYETWILEQAGIAQPDESKAYQPPLKVINTIK